MSPASLATSAQAAAHPGSRHSLLVQARQLLLEADSSHALIPSGLAPWLWRSWQRCLMQGRHPAERVEFEAVGPHALHRAQEQQHALLQAARPEAIRPSRRVRSSAGMGGLPCVCFQFQRLKISEVFTPPKAKLLFITYWWLIWRNSPRR